MNSSVALDDVLPWGDRRPSGGRTILICDSMETDGRFLLHTLASQYLSESGSKNASAAAASSSSFTWNAASRVRGSSRIGKNLKMTSENGNDLCGRVLWIGCGTTTDRQIATALKKMGCDLASTYLRHMTSSSSFPSSSSSNSSQPLHIISVSSEMANNCSHTEINQSSDDTLGNSNNESTSLDTYIPDLYRRIQCWLKYNQDTHNPPKTSSQGQKSLREPLIIVDDVSALSTLFGPMACHALIQTIRSSLQQQQQQQQNGAAATTATTTTTTTTSTPSTTTQEDTSTNDKQIEEEEEALLESALDSIQKNNDKVAQQSQQQQQQDDDDDNNKDKDKDKDMYYSSEDEFYGPNGARKITSSTKEGNENNDDDKNNNIMNQTPKKTRAQLDAELLKSSGYNVVSSDEGGGTNGISNNDSYKVIGGNMIHPWRRPERVWMVEEVEEEEEEDSENDDKEKNDHDGDGARKPKKEGNTAKKHTTTTTTTLTNPTKMEVKFCTNFDVVELDSQGYIVDKGDDDFQPSITWIGRKPGFEFKLGERGVGYYRTGKKVVVPSNIAY